MEAYTYLLPGLGRGEKKDELEVPVLGGEDCGGGECIRLAGKEEASYVGEKMLLYGLEAGAVEANRGFLAGGDCSSGARVVVGAEWLWDWLWDWPGAWDWSGLWDLPGAWDWVKD